MLHYIIRRCFIALMVALTVSIAAFVLLNVAVDPAQAIAGEDADLLLVQQIREQYGFDRPILVQYFDWISGFVSREYYPPAALQDQSASVNGKPTSALLGEWFPLIFGNETE